MEQHSIEFFFLKMMIPVCPGAPWVPKFTGTDCDLKYGDWKEQMQGLLEAQEIPEAKKVKILMGALGGDAKWEISVLADGDRDKANKIFERLDILYVGEIPLPVLQSHFFSCRQRQDESFKTFVLRLRELYCRLRRRSPERALVEDQLKEQLLLGLENGPFLRALRTYARQNPEGTFAALHQEALLLEAEYSQPRYELACAAINGPSRIDSRSQGTDWKAELKREILEEVKGQMREFTQEVMKELKSPSPVTQSNHAQPNYVHFQPQNISSWRRRGQPSSNMWDAEGRPICRRCQQSGHITRYCKESVLPNGNLN